MTVRLCKSGAIAEVTGAAQVAVVRLIAAALPIAVAPLIAVERSFEEERL